MPTIAITGASGKLGGATLSALLSRSLAAPSSIVALTSSHPGTPTWEALASRHPGVAVRHASFDEGAASFADALRPRGGGEGGGAAAAAVYKLFLVSTPRVEMDFGGAPPGEGREAHHRAAVDGAVAAGVRHVYYASLALASAPGGGAGRESRAAVMTAHLRTEAYLREVAAREGVRVTVLREGLYAESWPLYLGYYDLAPPPGGDDREVIRIPSGDGRVCWTAIADLGLASALVLAAPDDGEYAGRTVYLSTRPGAARTVVEIAGLVGRARAKVGRGKGEVRVEIGPRDEVERHYVRERGMAEPYVRWWSSTYEALRDGEALVDDPTLERLLAGVGATPAGVEETVERMVRG